MGEVYRGRDTRLDRVVAIKVLASSLAADVPARERFEREAKAISSLNHPNICALYDVGRERPSGDEAPVDFLVMEYVDGETLATRLARGPSRATRNAALTARFRYRPSQVLSPSSTACEAASSQRPISRTMLVRGTLTILSTITWDASFRPVRSPGGRLTRKSGASMQTVVIGHMVTLACVGLKASPCTTSAGRGLPV